MVLSTRRLSIVLAFAVSTSAPAGVALADASVGPGAYVGVFAGYGEIDAVARDYDPTVEEHYSPSGGLAGVQAGYDWASGSFVFGLAADAAWTSIRGSRVYSGGPVIFKTDQEWEGSLRARAGYVCSGALFYLTGGAAYSAFETKYSQVGLPFFVTDTDRWGWTAGAGFELPVTDQWSIAAEYRYSDYGKDGSSLTSPDGPYTLTADRATLGFNYRF